MTIGCSKFVILIWQANQISPKRENSGSFCEAYFDWIEVALFWNVILIQMSQSHSLLVDP